MILVILSANFKAMEKANRKNGLPFLLLCQKE